MDGSLKLTALATAVRLAIGLVFLRSALAKARRPLAFVQAVQGYAILPPAMAGPAAIGILGLEGGLAFVFLSGWGFQWGGPVALGLLGIFMLAVGINLRRGRRIPCGCFGTTDGLDSVRMAIRLVFLFSTIGKLRDLRGFLKGVVADQVLPAPLAVAYGLILVPLEGFVAFAFLSGRWVDIGVRVSLALLFSFFLAVGLNVLRHRDLSCYCFGAALTERISWRTLARTGLLLSGALVILLGGSSNAAVSASVADSLLKGILALFVLVAGMWILAVPDLLRLHPWRL